MSAQMTIFLTGLAGMIAALVAHGLSGSNAGAADEAAAARRESAATVLCRLPAALGTYALVLAVLAGLAFDDWLAGPAFVLGAAVAASVSALSLAQVGRDSVAVAMASAAGAPLGLGALLLLDGPGPMSAVRPVCFALGAIGAALLVPSRDVDMRTNHAVQVPAFQCAASAAAIGIALTLGAADTALLGPQHRLTVLPAALLAAALPCLVATPAAARFAPGVASRRPWPAVGATILYLAVALAVLHALDAARAIWFLLLAGVVAGAVPATGRYVDAALTWRSGSGGAVASAALAVLVMATAAVAMPEGARLYGVALAAVAMTAVSGLFLAQDTGRQESAPLQNAWFVRGAGMLSALAATGACIAIASYRDGVAGPGFDDLAFLAGLFVGAALAFQAAGFLARGDASARAPGAAGGERHLVALALLRRGAGITALILAPAGVAGAFGPVILAGVSLGALVCVAGLSFAASAIDGLRAAPAGALLGLVNLVALASLAAILLMTG